MNKFKFGFAGSLLLGALATAPASQAALVMSLDDPNDDEPATIIYDLSGDDLNGVEGVITFSGSVGAFNVNVTTGVSKPVIGPSKLDLNSIDVSGSAGTLNVMISDTDFTELPASTLTASYGGTTHGDVDFTFLFDSNNTEFGGTEFASGQFQSSVGNHAFSDDLFSSVFFEEGNPFSLTIAAQIYHSDGGQVTSFDAVTEPSPVPLPASVVLLGSALAGLFGFRKLSLA